MIGGRGICHVMLFTPRNFAILLKLPHVIAVYSINSSTDIKTFVDTEVNMRQILNQLQPLKKILVSNINSMSHLLIYVPSPSLVCSKGLTITSKRKTK